jgi:SNF2 family DNA or RNA helicase
MSIPKKTQMLDKFSKCEKGILYLTYKTGSEGLNLQHTNTVFLMDALWNASSGEQAIARVARQGQLSTTVNIVTFISNTGIEKAMLEKHINKIEIAEELMNGPVKKQYHTMKVNDVVKMVLEDDTAGLYQQLQAKIKTV